MGNKATVTAKVPTELKERLTKLGVNVSRTIREALEREAERLERERLRELSEEAGEMLQKIPTEEIMRSIRESREKR